MAIKTVCVFEFLKLFGFAGGLLSVALSFLSTADKTCMCKFSCSGALLKKEGHILPANVTVVSSENVTFLRDVIA